MQDQTIMCTQVLKGMCSPELLKHDLFGRVTFQPPHALRVQLKKTAWTKDQVERPQAGTPEALAGVVRGLHLACMPGALAMPHIVPHSPACVL